MTAGIRTTNLPRDDGAQPVEVLIHVDEGGQLKTRRQSLDIFISRILAQAGGDAPGATAVLAVLTARGFVVGSDGKLHLTQVEADLAAEIIRAKAAEVAAVQAATRADAARASHGRRVSAVVSNPWTGFFGGSYGPNDYTAYAVGVNVDRPVEAPHGFGFWLRNLDKLRVMRCIVYSRALTQADGPAGAGYTFPAPGVAGDTQVAGGQYGVDTIAANPLSAEAQFVVFPLDLPPLTPGFAYIAVLEADDRQGARAPITIATGRARSPAIDGAWKTGVIRKATGELIVPDTTIAVQLLERLPVETEGSGASFRRALHVRGDFQRYHAGLSDDATGYMVKLPEAVLSDLPQPLVVSPPGNVFKARFPSGSTQVDNETGQLIYNQWRQMGPGAGYRNVGNLFVNDGVSLLNDTDYVVDRRLGRIKGLKNVAPRNIAYNYTYALGRYVDLYIDNFSGGILAVECQPRNTDPDEYMTSNPSLRLFARIFVTRDGAELIPLWERSEISPYARRGEEWRLQQYIDAVRRRMPRTIRRARSGQSIRIVNYTDSIGAFGVGSSWYEPGGDRDALSFMNYLPADTLSTIPTYDGPLGAGKHVREAFVWHLAAALEDMGGMVEVLNMGIAGTTSRADPPSGGVGPGGMFRQRLDAAKALQPDVVVIGFGMNENGSPETYPNLVTMGQEFQQIGAELYFYTTPRPNPINGRIPEAWHLYTTRETVNAAETLKAACCELSLVTGPGNEGLMGTSISTACEQNYENHPGLYQYRYQGGYFALPFRGL